QSLSHYIFFLLSPPPPRPPLFPYTTLFRSSYEESPPSLTEVAARDRRWCQGNLQHAAVLPARGLHWVSRLHMLQGIGSYITAPRSEEHTSELQSRENLVCRLLLEKKKKEEN